MKNTSQSAAADGTDVSGMSAAEQKQEGADFMKEKKDRDDEILVCTECHHHQHISREEIPSDEILYQMAELFKTFGDPTRIRILTALSCQEMCVCDIAELLGMSQSAISHQLRVLKQMELVKFRREGKTVFYSLADSHVSTILAQGLDHVCE